MVDQTPFAAGRGTRIGDGSIVATYPLSSEWDGWHMAEASVDETGHFLTVRFAPPALDTQEPR